MLKKVDIVIADPSGNITIMVTTPVHRKDYKELSQKLLSIKSLDAEQVAFILPENPTAPYPEMEMGGLEFCGNASRAFALHYARSQADPPKELKIKVSGCPHPLQTRLNPETGFVEIDMPVPTTFHTFTDRELSLNKGGCLVSIDGISHLILEDIAPMESTFERLRDLMYEIYDPDMPAFGVMFCDTANDLMTPVVYVRDVDSTYFEGSCASGTVAASYAIAREKEDGVHRFTMQQPEGTLHTVVTKEAGRIRQIALQGLVTLSEPMTVELD